MAVLEGGDISIEHFLQDQLDFARGSLKPVFQDSTVLLTGATGILGSLVLEKLLRTCSEVDRVYVTVRGKGTNTASQRLKQLFSSKVFDRVRLEESHALNKVEILDLDLGLETHVATVRSSVTMIIHCALVTDAGHTMREAVDANIKQTAALLQLAYACKKLEAFVVVSSTLCHNQERIVEERFYPPPVTAQSMCVICDSLSESILNTDTSGVYNKVLRRLIVANTSASLITLAITEDLIKQGRKCLPLAIVRPSMLIPSYREPLAGWLTQTPGGLVRLVTQAMQGSLCTLRADAHLSAELVPADLAASLTLALASHIASIRRNWQNKEVEDPQEQNGIIPDYNIPIFNLVSTNHSPVSWREFLVCSLRHARSVPFIDTVWYPHLLLTKSSFWFSIWFYTLHLLPAMVMDSYYTFIENPNILNAKKSRFYKEYLKLRDCCESLSIHSVSTQKYRDGNTQALWRSLCLSDRTTFNFHTSQLDWSEYLYTLAGGIRLYCLADTLDTIPRAVNRMKKLKLLHYGTAVMITFVGLILVRLLVKLLLF